MRLTSIVILILLLPFFLLSQEIKETEINNDGIVFPRMDQTAIDALIPQEGQCVFNIIDECLQCFNGSSWYSTCHDTIWTLRPEGIAYVNRLSSPNLANMLPTIDRDLVVASDDDVSTGIRLYDFGSGGESYSIVSTNNSSSLGGGKFILYNDTGVGPASNKDRVTVNNIGNVGIATVSPKSRLEVTDGDIYISDISKGVIMKSPNGNCWRYTPNDAGTLTSVQITCPN